VAEIGRSEWLYHHSGFLRDIMQSVARDYNRNARYEWFLRGADDESCSRVNIIAGAMSSGAQSRRTGVKPSVIKLFSADLVACKEQSAIGIYATSPEEMLDMG
jgi:hypothetical protein